MNIGVLALQGGFAEHICMLQKLGINTYEVRRQNHLKMLDGLIIPGGESTTIGKIATEYDLIEPIRAFASNGKPIWGTCAGMIMLAKDVGMHQPRLELMDIKVKRNAFGRQTDSFQAEIPISSLDKNLENPPFNAIFIRAPLIESVGANVTILATLIDKGIVAAQQDNLLATSFHPELSDDTRFHQYFSTMINRR